ncbi:helix-turn-helix domain-containing protein [Microbacterium trichothecenolyticum]|uniref:helix-turn-helix domain-containing protein n=1 Tax=Microbacterium trichothecenolyticum TaxID=69370 RepID=UPI0035BE4C0D
MEHESLAPLRKRCLRLIEEHFTEPHADHAWFARRLHVSRRHLARAFEGGGSVAERLARRRLAQFVVTAALEPNTPLPTISARCGYASYETLRAQCHRHLARSPRKVRQFGASDGEIVGCAFIADPQLQDVAA